MKRCRLIKGALCLMAFGVAARTACAEGFDFRNVRWGMNRFEVMAAEVMAPKRMKRDELLYRVSLFRRPAYLMYRLYDDHLVGARYVLPVKGTDTTEQLVALVSLRYGAAGKQPSSQGTSRVWRQSDRTVHLFFPKKGQAVIDVLSEAMAGIPAREEARLRRRTSEELANHL